ncbi:NitT/TauT family transport system substrate-binding protein [Actinomadura pelletieri DSM 43383]|uniref:NitT/TauT family transport system substrate-binding protein n=1 Tax=Actinomadura pelletieri DSM 43383 TaxID=1120940 RepID=A0A495Q8T1_9ACTN|nr:ABC transporter substrate-binding protein [Actinomadura pelletieri]RKS67715.1 NitT/TauT family transport system substrate-binding protein [Actinomadura pelletieri DSM 43383]
MDAWTHLRRFAALATLVTLAACGGGGGGGAADTKGNGKLSFKVAVTEPDITTVPILAALDDLRGQGHDIKVVELAEPELSIEGLAKGDYALSAEATSAALLAVERKAPIKIIADAIGNQWAVYGKPGISSCDQLDGSPFGIFSEGATATAMVKEWVKANCSSGKQPKYLTIGGSDVRAQALVSGRINATALEVSDVVALESKGGEFAKIADFAESLPDLRPQTVYANSGFITEHKDVTQALVTALVRQHAKINADPRYLVRLAGKYLPEEDGADMTKVAERYVQARLFDAAALTEKNVQGTIEFFVRAGVIKKGMSAKDAADLTFVQAAR